MEYRVLGPLEVIGDGGEMAALGGAKPRALLALLLVEHGRAVPIERLADELWAESPPPAAAATLHSYVSRLRRVLPDGALVTEGRSYAVRIGTGEVDRDRFEEGLAAGRDAMATGDPARASDLFAGALSLWRGPALPELADTARGRNEAARLEELRLAAEDDAFEAQLAAGRHETVLPELERAVAEEPLRERRWGQLMRALYRAGRQADALRRYQDLRRVLAEELGLDPGPELSRLEQAILVQDPILDPPAARVGRQATTRRRLPAPITTFVGRTVEVPELSAASQANRMVTVVGPGGVGKTRLAYELARARLDESPGDEVIVAELGAVADPALVRAVVAEAVGAEDSDVNAVADTLSAVVGEQGALLVLDNCEHLLSACADLADNLLRAVSELHIVATSREPLGVPGEAVWRLGPLDTPDAVALFRERAGQSAPPVDADVATVCSRLDGLPLAIELAAARLRSMTLQQLVAGLDNRFRLLGAGPRTGPARHRTLRALVEWSYDLLPVDEQRLLAILSVFAGSFDSEAAEAVAAGIPELGPVDGVVRLADLADKSLVDLEPGNRYRLLETIREFASERLHEVGLAATARSAHLAHFCDLARHAAGGLRTRDQADWLRRCDADLANFRAAIDWALADARRATQALDMGVDLFRFWLVRGHAAEGRRVLEAALAAVHEPTPTRARALLRAGGLADRHGAIDAARAHLQAALALAREVGDRDVEAFALNEMGTTARDAGDLDAGIDLGERAVAVARDGAGSAALGTTLCNLGGTYLAVGRHDEARRIFEEALSVLDADGDVFGLAVARDNLGFAAFQQGDLAACRRFATDAKALHEELGDANGAAISLSMLAQAEQAEGNLEAADEAASAAVAVLREVGAPVNLSIVLGTLAEIRVGRGLDPTALLEEKLEWDTANGFLPGEATALIVRARFEAGRSNLGAAAETIADATAKARESGYEAVLAEALLTAGDVDLRRGLQQRARESYDEAVVLFDRLGQSLAAAQVQDRLARAEAARGAGGLVHDG